jgi:hypothetical protein
MLEAANRQNYCRHMTKKEVSAFVKKHWQTMSDFQLAQACKTTVGVIDHTRRNLGLNRSRIPRPTGDPAQRIQENSSIALAREQRKQDKKLIEQLQETNDRLERERNAALSLKQRVTSHTITAKSQMNGEATLIALASDWHIEEPVRPAQVNGLNEYNLEIARKRADNFFATLLRLVQIEQQNTRVHHLILALLGDFITNDIHEELAETAQLEPAVAIRMAQELIISGIDHLLSKSKLTITVVCHSGNHARTTREQRHATEHGHSLEWLLYHALADHYENNNRITFLIPEAYHSYVQVYGLTVRFHHGHEINYKGGVGGITIPVRKAIAQWNTLRPASVDCFGHFHQAFDGNNFICNGSMMGYNAYALSIKAAFEEPVQMLFGIHSKLGKYITRQIKFLADI